ncbi:hypothetical protein FRB99_003643 [Tulasnella sp. 403]|nr:hypothetical protein FRB99_003643 [Tulasnella sp. 403]
MLCVSGALVSRSFTLAFIVGEEWVPGEMDIYVGYTDIEPVITYLPDHRSWHVGSDHRTYIKETDGGPIQDGVMVDNMEELDLFATAARTSTSASWVQNWMDADSVTIPYPDMTSRRPSTPYDKNGPKYVARGYKVVGVEGEEGLNRETAMEIKFSDGMV